MTDLELPDPFTPPDCNLRGLPFMPLQTERLLDSDMMASLPARSSRRPCGSGARARTKSRRRHCPTMAGYWPTWPGKSSPPGAS